MKKKLTALLCTAALLLSLLAVPASAGNSLFFLSLNEIGRASCRERV